MFYVIWFAQKIINIYCNPNNYMMYNGQHKLFWVSETIKSQNVRSLKNKKY